MRCKCLLTSCVGCRNRCTLFYYGIFRFVGLILCLVVHSPDVYVNVYISSFALNSDIGYEGMKSYSPTLVSSLPFVFALKHNSMFFMLNCCVWMFLASQEHTVLCKLILICISLNMHTFAVFAVWKCLLFPAVSGMKCSISNFIWYFLHSLMIVKNMAKKCPCQDSLQDHEC